MVSEVVVVGGGLAGASAALDLARRCRPVRVIERSGGPHHKVCGEFVSIEVQRDLARLGVDLTALGAVPIDRVRVIAHGRCVEAKLPFTAMGICRAALDEAVLEAAERAGAVIERGVKVTGLDAGEVQTSAGPRSAATIFLASGKHDLRGFGREAGAAAREHVGFKMHWRIPENTAQAIGGAVELALFEGGYVGLQRVATDTLNMSLLIRRDSFAALGGSWDNLLAEMSQVDHVARRLDGAQPLFERPLTIANLPYGFVCDPAAPLPPNVYRLGDQAALTAPLTGDGMAIATRTARMAVASLAATGDAGAYHRLVSREIATQVRRAMLLQTAAARPAAHRWLVSLLGLWPGALGRLAGLTRLPERTDP